MTRVRRIARWPLGLIALVPVALFAGTAVAHDDDLVAGIVAGTLIVLGALAAILSARALHTAESLALCDPLTDLPNRALLDDRVEQALRRARRTGEPFAVVILDLDGFKEINDIRGHRAGDEVLTTLARRLEDVVRESDTVARIGGDEFAVLSLWTGNEDEAAALAARLRQALREPIEVAGVTVEIDASIGWALFPLDGTTIDGLLGRADRQMYATKRDLEDKPRRGSLDAGIVREFEGALERNELVVHYQPILRLADGSLAGVEALVRRFHPERGVVSPAEFIPHVERTALIRAVTGFVVQDALRLARELDGGGTSAYVSVNVPCRALGDMELANAVESLLAGAGLAGSQLVLEIIPSSGSDVDCDAVALLRGLGVRLAVDDFGRASSLTLARAIPLDQVKVDATFVHGLGRSAADAAVVRSLAALGRQLEVEIVAEGIETPQAWELAHELGCDLGQGFYAAAPLPREDLHGWLETDRSAVA